MGKLGDTMRISLRVRKQGNTYHVAYIRLDPEGIHGPHTICLPPGLLGRRYDLATNEGREKLLAQRMEEVSRIR